MISFYIKNKKINFIKNNKGFTLLEILVVVGIIAVLASLVTVMLGNSRDKSNDSKISTQLSQMNSQSLLFNGATGTGYVVASPYLVSSGILGAQNGGTLATGTLFNDTNLDNNSLYLLASKLPSGARIYYGWDGANPSTNGRWFFVSSLSTGAFCVDYFNNKSFFEGTPPVTLSDFTDIFTNATAIGGYSCE